MPHLDGLHWALIVVCVVKGIGLVALHFARKRSLKNAVGWVRDRIETRPTMPPSELGDEIRAEASMLSWRLFDLAYRFRDLSER